MKKLSIEPPIIVDETGPIYVFRSVEAAEKYLEPIDVANNRYVAFDSQGRLLRLQATEPRVTIEAAEEYPTHAEALRLLLVEFLKDMGLPEVDVIDKSLPELVESSLQYHTR